ncbi:hypothetical protein [Planosporangium flavigriseum]|uniref:Uncharacterized protein n=1 Tax=Planosporangium flavigriseum TaxID=373681 RepID=A0A8J3LU85_9ACTN|nr:hypothetical protein [Planosporangium flavigriseum]GIG76865.1 hypothetical protein Pfl04_52690 [Planosporangium flavigriseum]
MVGAGAGALAVIVALGVLLSSGPRCRKLAAELVRRAIASCGVPAINSALAKSGDLQPNRPIRSVAALQQEYGLARGTFVVAR